MYRLGIILLLAASAAAQVRGVPPSALSFGGGAVGQNRLGPPAAAGSLGPAGLGPTFSFRPSPRFQHGPGVDRGRQRGPVFPVVIPYYTYPYYPAAIDPGYLTYRPHSIEDAPVPPRPEPDSSGNAYDAGYAAGVRAMRDLRPEPPDAGRYGEHYLDSREEARRERRETPSVAVTTGAAREAAPPAEPSDPGPATILIFKDGRRIEVHNYAILGASLFDLARGATRKIALSDLDLDATVKANDERGISFKLPSRS